MEKKTWLNQLWTTLFHSCSNATPKSVMQHRVKELKKKKKQGTIPLHGNSNCQGYSTMPASSQKSWRRCQISFILPDWIAARSSFCHRVCSSAEETEAISQSNQAKHKQTGRRSAVALVDKLSSHCIFQIQGLQIMDYLAATVGSHLFLPCPGYPSIYI